MCVLHCSQAIWRSRLPDWLRVGRVLQHSAGPPIRVNRQHVSFHLLFAKASRLLPAWLPAIVNKSNYWRINNDLPHGGQ